MSWPDGLGITAWSRICRELDCWWCGPPRDTDAQAAEDLADHMDDHYAKEAT